MNRPFWFLIGMAALTAFCLLVMGALVAVPAQTPQAQCDNAKAIIKLLKTKYGEVLLFEGRTNLGNIVKIFMNLKTQTWTSVVEGDVVMCVTASGKGLKVERSALDGPEL